MFAKFRQKKFWTTLILYFLFLFVLNISISWIFMEKGKSVVTPDTLMDIAGNAILMSILFSLVFKPPPGNAPDETITEISKRDFRYYAHFFLFLSALILVMGAVTMLLVWIGFRLFSNEEIPAKTLILKPFVILLFMSLLFTLFSFVVDRLKLRNQ